MAHGLGRLAHLADMPHFVYLCFSADDELLYVGCTHNLKQRQYGHSLNSAWYPKLDHVRLVGPFVGAGAKRRAFAAERGLIKRLAPQFNADMAAGQREGWVRRRKEIERAHSAGFICSMARCRVCGGYSQNRRAA